MKRVDLRLVEQLTDHEQLEALVQILKYMKLHMFDGKRTLQEAVEELYTAMQKKNLQHFAREVYREILHFRENRKSMRC